MAYLGIYQVLGLGSPQEEVFNTTSSQDKIASFQAYRCVYINYLEVTDTLYLTYLTWPHVQFEEGELPFQLQWFGGLAPPASTRKVNRSQECLMARLSR